MTNLVETRSPAAAGLAPSPATVAALSYERRVGDRRHRPTPMFSRYTFFGGRRQQARREHEREGSFVDLHGTRVFLVVMAIVVLNLADAWFTLLFLSYGGQELNPFVQAVLDLSDHHWPFLVFKTIGIGAACAFPHAHEELPQRPASVSGSCSSATSRSSAGTSTC